MSRTLALRWLALAFVAVGLASLTHEQAFGQLPVARLASVFPAGGKAGSNFEVALAGTDLDGVTKLVFSHPGITGTVKMETLPGMKDPQPSANTMVVTIAADVPPGLYDVRTVGRYGISSPRAFQVGDLTEVEEVEGAGPTDKDSVLDKLGRAQEITLPVLVNGRYAGPADDDFYKFNAKKGDRILADCWGQRIDSRIDGTLVIYDAQGNELDKNQSSTRRDPLADFVVPADGVYTIKLYDALYQGGPDHFYRLAVGVLPHIDYILPPAGTPGSKQKFVLYGRNLPGATPVQGVTVDGKAIGQLPVEIDVPAGPATLALTTGSLATPSDAGQDAFAYHLKTPTGVSNSVSIGFATGPVVAEIEPNSDPNKPQTISVPCELYGQFFPRRDQDWVRFDAKKGDTFMVEVISQRMGLPTDPYLLVQQISKDDKGVEKITDLQEGDDLPLNLGGNDFSTVTDDPQYRFVAPADASYRMLVRDRYFDSRGDPRYIYRLSIRKEQPDFRLVGMARQPNNPQNNQGGGTWSPLLRKGGTELLDVMAFRRDGYVGPIELSMEGLPAGVSCAGATIGPNLNKATLVLKAADDAAEWAGIVKVIGKAKVGEAEIVREARSGTVVWTGQQNQTASQGRVAQSIALAVSAAEVAPFVVELKNDQPWEMSKAGKLEIPVKVTRRGDFKGNLALTPIGLPQNVQVANVTINADKADGVLALTLPQNAPTGTFTFYVQAATQVSYKRNPEGAAAAAEAKKALDAAVNETTEANKKATADKANADKAATESAAAAKKAAEAKVAAEKLLADAKKAQEASEAQLKAAKDAEKEGAGKALAEASAKVKAAEEAHAAAEKAANDTAAAAKTAADAKAAADKAALDAAEKLKTIQAAQAAADKRAKDMATAAAPKNINVMDASTPVTVTVTDAPITLAALAPSKIKQGEKLEIPVAVTRKYGYADTVEVEVSFPNGVGNIKIAKLVLNKDQNDGKLIVEAAANATPGEHVLNVKATAKFNNASLTTTQPANLAVEKVEAAK